MWSKFLVSALLLACTPQSLGSNVVKEGKIEQWTQFYELGVLGRSRSSVRNVPQDCTDGKVTIDGEDFPCKEVDFYSYLSLQDMEITQVPHQLTGIAGSDIWGWLSPTGKEFTLMCMDNGVAFIDTTDPADPCVLGLLPAARRGDPWCDVKVYKDTAYIVKDSRGGDFANDTTIGGQVVDLLPLDELTCNPEAPVILEHDFLWDFHGSSHNLIVNTETGFLYSVGTDYCSGGLIVIDLNNDRLRPEQVACIDGDNYTHDAQCVVYDGPDTRFTGQEICFAFNEDTLTIWDVTEKLNPIMLSRTGYPSQVYCHQGWLNGDMSLLLMDDELNELCSSGSQASFCTTFPLGPLDNVTRTSTIVMDVSSLTDPIYEGRYLHEDEVIDHNLYFWGPIHAKGWGGNPPMEEPPSDNYAYLNNYLSGLRILNVSTGNLETFEEVGFFDVAPDAESLSFLGSWSGYMHPSGAYAISSIDRGLFMLRPRMTFDTTLPPVVSPPADDPLEETLFLLVIVLAALVALLILVIIPYVTFNARRQAAIAEQA